MFSSWVMVLKLSKKFHFLQFCADHSKKSKSVKPNYLYASEGSCSAFSKDKMVIVYYATTYCCGDVRVWSQTILLNFNWVSIYFYYLIVNFSWMVTQTPVNRIIFCKIVMRIFGCNIQIALTDLDFLLKSTQNCIKCTFFG